MLGLQVRSRPTRRAVIKHTFKGELSRVQPGAHGPREGGRAGLNRKRKRRHPMHKNKPSNIAVVLLNRWTAIVPSPGVQYAKLLGKLW